MDQRRIYARPVRPAPWDVVAVDQEGRETVIATLPMEEARRSAALKNMELQQQRRTDGTFADLSRMTPVLSWLETENILIWARTAINTNDFEAGKSQYKKYIGLREAFDFAVVGDSHSYTFADVPKSLIVWMGSITMHRVGRDGTRFLDAAQMFEPAPKTIAFCFGEIDCRNHVYQQAAKQSLPEETIVEQLVSAYMRAIADTTRGLTSRIGVVTPPPPHEITPDSPFYPAPVEMIGRLQDRIRISKLVVDRLVDECREREYFVIDLYHNTVDADGSMLEAYNSDAVHVYNSAGKAVATDLIKRMLAQYLGSDPEPERRPDRRISGLWSRIGTRLKLSSSLAK